MKWIWFLFGLVCGNEVVNLINKERRLYDLKDVVYNERLEEDLKLYYKVYGSELINKNTLEFSTFDKYRNKGFVFLTQGIYKISMKNNIKFRLGQRECFDAKKCKTGPFDGYESCNVGECNHFWYPYYITKSLSEIACIDTKPSYSCFGKVDLLLYDNPLKN